MLEGVTAIYPGSFDPVTNGHLELVNRARHIFHRVVVSVLMNEQKKPLFTLPQRVAFLEQVTRPWENVEVASFQGLLIDFADEVGARVIMRGIRAVTDYDYEFQMALMNRRMQPQIETIFMVPSEAYAYLSSSLVKEVSRLGGDVAGLVPEAVEKELVSRFGR